MVLAERPEGPFLPQPHPIRSALRIAPCVFKDDDSLFE